MGQYYKPVIIQTVEDRGSLTEILKSKLDKVEINKPLVFMYSWDYENGSKLMEHSWIGNNFVRTFEELISENGPHHKARVVWAGDYAEDEKLADGTDEEPSNLYGLCENDAKHIDKTRYTTNYRYVVNHTKKEYVDKKLVPVTNVWTDPDTKKEYPYVIHPLPLLTAEGNGQGGGDFRGDDPNELVGSWARDIISVERKKPKGYKILEFDLKE